LCIESFSQGVRKKFELPYLLFIYLVICICVLLFPTYFAVLYQKINHIGSGQYGDVYEGVWLSHNKTVAVKTLKVSTMLFFIWSFYPAVNQAT